MTAELLAALEEINALAAHIDTRDPRPIETIGRLDLENVRLAVVHFLAFVRALLANPGAGVYVPVSQGTFGFIRDAVLLLAARLMRRRRYVHLHGGYFGEFYRTSPWLMRELIRLSLTDARQAWVLTPRLKREFTGLIPERRVRVIENAVQDAALDSAAVPSADPFPRAESRFRLLYLSNLIPEKGCFDLLTAAEGLGGTGTPLDLWFAGDVSSVVREQIEARAQVLESNGSRIHVSGAVSGDVRLGAYRWADAFVLPTRYPEEGQPLVLLEAMSMSLPIITTDHRGIPDTVRQGVDALLVPPGDTDALRQAIACLMSDDQLRHRLAASARNRYESNYRPARFRRDVQTAIRGDQSQSPSGLSRG